jgi:arylsulfatase A-like enzyme
VAAAFAFILLSYEPSKDPASLGSPAPTAGRPNVIIYLVDTLRADHLGVYGYYRDTSPVLDRWASEAVVFERAYAPCSWTKPSVVSLLSGLDPVSHGVEDRLDVIPADLKLLSERLRASGYSTFAAVTNPNVLPQWGFDRGFDSYVDLDSAGHRTRADTVSDYVLEKMGELAHRQPFLLYVHLIDPHGPYEPPAPFDTRFPRSPAFPAKRSVGHYDGEIAFVDSQFGRILDGLRAHGLDENTMTIFVADHGEELLDHGGFGHGSTLFEEVVRVPLVIRFPAGIHAGTRVGARASLTDLVPTVLSALGESAPTDLDGHDLTELLNGEAPPWADRELFLSLRTTGPNSNLVRGVLSGSHKYVRRSRPTVSESLYDLERDPAETEDLAELRANSRRRMAATLDAYLGAKSRGIHLRIVNDSAGDPVRCEAALHTTGRFVEVSDLRMESEDHFELSPDSRRLRLDFRLENRQQSTTAGPRLVPDEDGLIFVVRPPDAPVVVQRLQLLDGEALPLRAGPRRRLETIPFSFEATDAAWSVRDIDELLADSPSAEQHPGARAYLGVIEAPAALEDVPEELLERLRALGYMNDSTTLD